MKEEASGIENADELVDRLLRDQDFLMARELKHRAEELNQLILQAQRRKLKIDVSTSNVDVPDGSKVTWIELRIYKEL